MIITITLTALFSFMGGYYLALKNVEHETKPTNARDAIMFGEWKAEQAKRADMIKWYVNKFKTFGGNAGKTPETDIMNTMYTVTCKCGERIQYFPSSSSGNYKPTKYWVPSMLNDDGSLGRYLTPEEYLSYCIKTDRRHDYVPSGKQEKESAE